MNKFFFILLMTFLQFVFAAIFGASNYEECVNDGTVGRSDTEISALVIKCRSQFPKLYKLSLKKDVNLVCRDLDEKFIYRFKVKGSKVKLDITPNITFIKTSQDKSLITFSGNGHDKDTKQAVKFYGKISPIDANGDLKVEYVDRTKSDIVYSFSCYEDK